MEKVTNKKIKCFCCSEEKPYDDVAKSWAMWFASMCEPDCGDPECEYHLEDDGFAHEIHMCLKCLEEVGEEDAERMAFYCFRSDWDPYK